MSVQRVTEDFLSICEMMAKQNVIAKKDNKFLADTIMHLRLLLGEVKHLYEVCDALVQTNCTTAIQEQNRQLLAAGGKMARLCFNLSFNGCQISDKHRHLVKEMLQQWEAAAKTAQSPLSVDEILQLEA